ncbi:hypothetical protein SO802_000395 [Lithocarpus litseifolius]|uniref:Uncharacterized protein n=1 Tax=Lithocarpus litseifolius TaxID=425828 RepID=A0AAW2DX77_9ROSI
MAAAAKAGGDHPLTAARPPPHLQVHGWCRCGNQQWDRTKGRIAVLYCPGHGRRHLCEGCKDHHLGFPGIQSLSHRGIALVRTAGSHRNLVSQGKICEESSGENTKCNNI